MSDFASSHIGRLRAVVGSRLLLAPGACVVVEDEGGRVLLGLRSDFQVWGFPGGMAEEGEDIVTCAARETLEESGLRLSELMPFGYSSNPATATHTYPNGDVCHCFCMLFATRTFEGTPVTDGAETLQLSWYELDDLPDLVPGTQLVAAAFIRWKTTGTFQMI